MAPTAEARAALFPEGYTGAPPPKGAKRKPDDGAGPAAKKPKNPPPSDDEVSAMVSGGTVGKLKVDELKGFLKGKGIAYGNAKKSELVELVIAQF